MSDPDTTLEQDATPAPESIRGVVIRHVVERQLGAGHTLGMQLIGASTDVSVALAHAPSAAIDEIHSGATLPAALLHTGREVRGVVSSTGTRVRGALGNYVGSQATLPNAVVVGAADVAEAVLRAQGAVAATVVDSAFTLATTAARGGHVIDALSRERRELAERTGTARTDIAESLERAAEEIRGAVTDHDYDADGDVDEYREALSE